MSRPAVQLGSCVHVPDAEGSVFAGGENGAGRSAEFYSSYFPLVAVITETVARKLALPGINSVFHGG